MIRVFLRGLAAHFRAGRTLLVLGVLGVALGVASVLSIQILNGSALGAFEGGLRAVSGEADLTILGKVPTVPDSWVREALSERGVEAAWPVVRTPVKLEGPGETFLDLVGVDFLAPVWFPWDVPAGEVAAALGEPALALTLDAASARQREELRMPLGDPGPEHAARLEQAGEALGTEAAGQAVSKGRAMDHEQTLQAVRRWLAA